MTSRRGVWKRSVWKLCDVASGATDGPGDSGRTRPDRIAVSLALRGSRSPQEIPRPALSSSIHVGAQAPRESLASSQEPQCFCSLITAGSFSFARGQWPCLRAPDFDRIEAKAIAFDLLLPGLSHLISVRSGGGLGQKYVVATIADGGHACVESACLPVVVPYIRRRHSAIRQGAGASRPVGLRLCPGSGTGTTTQRTQ